MKKIIVTVTDKSKSFKYDVELPANLTLDKLSDDLVQCLMGHNPSIYFRADQLNIYSTFCKKLLTRSDTLESAGVWNGDILILS